MPTSFYTLPTITAGQSITPRAIFTSINSTVFRNVPSGYVIDGARSRDTGQGAYTGNSTSLLRCGLLMGKITTGGKYRPTVLGVLNRTGALNATTLTVAPAVATEIQRLVTLDGTSNNFIVSSPTSAGGTVVSTTVSILSATTGASGTSSYVTLSSSINSVTVSGGIITPADGSQTCLTVLWEGAGFGIDVTDVSGASIDQALTTYYVGGDLIATFSAQYGVINLTKDDYGVSLDTSVEALLKTRIRSTSNQWTFSDDR